MAITRKSGFARLRDSTYCCRGATTLLKDEATNERLSPKRCMIKEQIVYKVEDSPSSPMPTARRAAQRCDLQHLPSLHVAGKPLSLPWDQPFCGIKFIFQDRMIDGNEKELLWWRAASAALPSVTRPYLPHTSVSGSIFRHGHFSNLATLAYSA